MVRLGTVHFQPRGGDGTAMGQCKLFEPLIAEAGRQNVDMLVLGEVLTSAYSGKKVYEMAEPIPGPSTEYFIHRCALCGLRVYSALGGRCRCSSALKSPRLCQCMR